MVHDLLGDDGGVDPALADDVEAHDALRCGEAGLVAVIRVDVDLVVEVLGIDGGVDEGARQAGEYGVAGGHGSHGHSDGEEVEVAEIDGDASALPLDDVHGGVDPRGRRGGEGGCR